MHILSLPVCMFLAHFTCIVRSCSVTEMSPKRVFLDGSSSRILSGAKLEMQNRPSKLRIKDNLVVSMLCLSAKRTANTNSGKDTTDWITGTFLIPRSSNLKVTQGCVLMYREMFCVWIIIVSLWYESIHKCCLFAVLVIGCQVLVTGFFGSGRLPRC